MIIFLFSISFERVCLPQITANAYHYGLLYSSSTACSWWSSYYAPIQCLILFQAPLIRPYFQKKGKNLKTCVKHYNILLHIIWLVIELWLLDPKKKLNLLIARARVPLKYLTTNIGARPMCSLKNVEARDYLLNTLYELANQTNHLFISTDPFGNILSVLEGSNGPDNALLVSSHYDTVCLSPGKAKKEIRPDLLFEFSVLIFQPTCARHWFFCNVGAYDDTSGVVTILEVLRALVNSPQLPHSVLFLLNNGEEMGLLGSAYFVQNSPYAPQ